MDTLKQKVLSSKLLQLVVVMGTGFFFFSLIFLLPGEASSTKNLRIEQAKLDEQLATLKTSYTTLSTQLNEVATKGEEIRKKRDELESQIESKITPEIKK